MSTIETNYIAADHRSNFVDNYNNIPTLEALAVTYADEYAGLYNGEFDPAVHGDEDNKHDLDSACHDHARDIAFDDLNRYNTVLFYMITYPDQVFHRKPFDNLGGETPQQIAIANIEEIVRDRAIELIAEMNERGELETC